MQYYDPHLSAISPDSSISSILLPGGAPLLTYLQLLAPHRRDLSPYMILEASQDFSAVFKLLAAGSQIHEHPMCSMYSALP
jgi:hypothetical protein